MYRVKRVCLEDKEHYEELMNKENARERRVDGGQSVSESGCIED